MEKQHSSGHVVTTLGAIIYTGLGILGAIAYGVGQFLAGLELQTEGSIDAQVFADHIVLIAVSKAFTATVAAVGAVLAGIGIFKLEDRRRSIWWALLVGSFPLLAVLPLGTLIALMVLLGLVGKREEFFA